MTTFRWNESGTQRIGFWRSENAAPAPSGIVVITDDIAADKALRIAQRGSSLLWRGDFQNARQLMRALDRRLEKRASRAPQSTDPGEVFLANRKARAERAAILGKILIPLQPDYSISLRRAPDAREACAHAYGQPVDQPAEVSSDSVGEETLVSLPELLGVISAYEWHRKGIEVGALGARIHPAHGVFAPTRDEYIDLVADASWPQGIDHPVVWDIGTGTGVLAAVLARRGAREVVATDINPRAVQCARDNVDRLGLAGRVTVVQADLWPDVHDEADDGEAGDDEARDTARADVVVCNPPWIPGRPTSALEQGIYDPDSDVLHRFLSGLADHLTPQGEGWLILSDLAEHLGLRTRDDLLSRIDAAGLTVVGTSETTPRHPRAADSADPLHAARSKERTILWRLGRG
ncbi:MULTISPECIES: methyltransferase [unclassified Dietzia]|uniref:methyltransferase n=1 Tax=unclassified Dietzia TaxID=2617939 RepID=UPI0015F87373|nr:MULTISPECIES: class I SAM-dependent methyltransferase [unclassified Dietzia]MBB1023375.1 class I SAM-dependent methyltransferase [Dietzia sp. DQ12-76]MBB1029286.1 class I SAM-dependent methyltransferase [Dietzia sp. DQ11-38-2]